MRFSDRDATKLRRKATDLREERAKVFQDMKAVSRKSEDEGRDLHPDEAKKYDGLSGRLDSLTQEIDQLDAQAREGMPASPTRERMLGGESPGGRTLGGAARDVEESNAWVRRWLLGNEGNESELPKRVWADFGGLSFSRNGHGAPQIESRDALKGTGPAGGNLVPTAFIPTLAEHYVEQAAVAGLATLRVTEAGEDLLAPKTTAHPANPGIVAEGALIPEADATFGQQTLKAYKYASLHQASREVIEDSAVDLVDYLARRAAEGIANGSGAHFVTGTGTGQPEGVQTNSTVGKAGPTGQSTTVTADDLIDLLHSLASGYRNNGSWLMHDATLAKVRKLKDTTNQYLWRPGLEAGAPETLLGRPVFTDNTMPQMAASSKSILFGDFERYYLVRVVRGVLLERSDDFAFGNDLVTFRAILRADGKPIITDAVKAYQNSAT